MNWLGEWECPGRESIKSAPATCLHLDVAYAHPKNSLDMRIGQREDGAVGLDAPELYVFGWYGKSKRYPKAQVGTRVHLFGYSTRRQPGVFTSMCGGGTRSWMYTGLTPEADMWRVHRVEPWRCGQCANHMGLGFYGAADCYWRHQMEHLEDPWLSK